MTPVLEDQLSKIWSLPIKTEVSQALGINMHQASEDILRSMFGVYCESTCMLRDVMLRTVVNDFWCLCNSPKWGDQPNLNTHTLPRTLLLQYPCQYKILIAALFVCKMLKGDERC